MLLSGPMGVSPGLAKEALSSEEAQSARHTGLQGKANSTKMPPLPSRKDYAQPPRRASTKAPPRQGSAPDLELGRGGAQIVLARDVGAAACSPGGGSGGMLVWSTLFRVHHLVVLVLARHAAGRWFPAASGRTHRPLLHDSYHTRRLPRMARLGLLLAQLFCYDVLQRARHCPAPRMPRG